MKKELAIVYVEDHSLSDELLGELTEFKNIHLYIREGQIRNIDFHNSKVTLFCFSEDEISQAKKSGFDYHICAKGAGVLSAEFSKMLKDVNGREVFWFPSQSCVLSGVDIYADKFTELNIPICVNFNKILNKDLVFNDFYVFLKKLNLKFKNPIYEIDLDLLKDPFSENNFLIIQKDFQVVINNVVLGLFGDWKVSDLNKFNMLNIKGMSKSKVCLSCEWAENCKAKGLGYIQEKEGIRDCIGVKLYEAKKAEDGSN